MQLPDGHQIFRGFCQTRKDKKKEEYLGVRSENILYGMLKSINYLIWKKKKRFGVGRIGPGLGTQARWEPECCGDSVLCP